MTKFKKGDKVEFGKEGYSRMYDCRRDFYYIGTVKKVGIRNLELSTELGICKVPKKECRKLYNPFKDGDLYMVFGTGCNNKSSLYKSKEEAEEYSKNLDKSWTGDIVIMKVSPQGVLQVEKSFKKVE